MVELLLVLLYMVDVGDRVCHLVGLLLDFVHVAKLFVQFLHVLFDVVVLSPRHIKPNIKSSLFARLKTPPKIPLHCLNNSLCPLKIPFIPVLILHVFYLLAVIS